MIQVSGDAVRNTHTEGVQEHSPFLPLLLGEDVLGKLMDRWNRKHMTVNVQRFFTATLFNIDLLKRNKL